MFLTLCSCGHVLTVLNFERTMFLCVACNQCLDIRGKLRGGLGRLLQFSSWCRSIPQVQICRQTCKKPCVYRCICMCICICMYMYIYIYKTSGARSRQSMAPKKPHEHPKSVPRAAQDRPRSSRNTPRAPQDHPIKSVQG